MMRTALWLAVLFADGAYGACDSAETQGDMFPDNLKWAGVVFCVFSGVFGLMLLFLGLPLQRDSRNLFGSLMGASVSIWVVFSFSEDGDNASAWALIAVVVPIAWLFGKIMSWKPRFGLFVIGFLFGAFLGFIILVCGISTLWGNTHSVLFAQLVAASCAIMCAVAIVKTSRYGRRILICMYTSLLGSIALFQPLNHVFGPNNMHAYMVIDCDRLPKDTVYYYIAIVSGTAMVGFAVQLYFSSRLQKKMGRKRTINVRGQDLELSIWGKLAALLGKRPTRPGSFRKNELKSEPLSEETVADVQL